MTPRAWYYSLAIVAVVYLILFMILSGCKGRDAPTTCVERHSIEEC